MYVTQLNSNVKSLLSPVTLIKIIICVVYFILLFLKSMFIHSYNVGRKMFIYYVLMRFFFN